jgi:membrane protease YdiL (CAAX protease family)
MFHLPTRQDMLSIDLLLALALAYAWCMGVHHALVIMPSVWANPTQFYHFWGVGRIFRTDSIGNWLLVAAWIGVATPILEELFFRGLLLDAWCASRSTLASVFLSSTVFGLTHGRTAIMAFGLGVVLAIVYLRYRSLWPCIAIHGAYNVLQITPGLTALTQGKSYSAAGSVSAWIFELGLTVAFVPLAILFWRRFRPA